jgi:general secretion pathway protein D
MLMKTRYWKKYLGGLLCLCLCAALDVRAQQRGGGGGGFGGFGGFGGGAGRGNTSQQAYTPNGQVGNATISVDDSGNLVVIGDDATIAQIQQAVAAMDLPKPQVLIKVVFLEVQHNDSLDIGVEGGWARNVGGTNNPLNVAAANAFGASPLGSVFPTTNLNAFGQAIGAFGPNPPGAGLYQILGAEFQVTLRAIAQAGKAQLLSRPSILARDRQPATIQVGQNVPLVQSVTYAGIASTPVNNFTYQPVGIILRVTPYITPDGMIQMIVSPSISALDPGPGITIAQGITAPIINVRSADTVAITPDGQTVVIGGLMTSDKASSDSKIPFLGDIPLLGNLFKRQTKTGAKRELLIFLTPHIVRMPTQLAALSEKEQGQNPLIRKSVSESELDRFLERVPMKKEK